MLYQRHFITKYGFGDNINYYDSPNSEYPFIGRELSMSTDKISEPTKREIDRQVSVLVTFAFKKAYDLIRIHKSEFLRMVQLITKERTVDGKDLGLDLDDTKTFKQILENINESDYI